MAQLGVGLIGCGNISTIYLENMPLFRGLKLIACADVRADAAAAQARRFGIEALEIETLLQRPDIDLIVNLTVPEAHFAVSRAALMAGKHVFCEKPFTVEVGEAVILVSDAADRGLKIGGAPDTFLGGGGQVARELVDSGRLGTILSGSCYLMSHGMEHWHPNPTFFFKPGGGPVLDMAPYYLAALINLIGPVQSVQARASMGFSERIVTAPGPMVGKAIQVEVPTTVMGLLHFVSGADIQFTMSWDVWRHSHPPLELYGANGSLRLPDPNFFGGIVEYTEADSDWHPVDSSARPFGKPNWRSPAWPEDMPSVANYRCLGLAELASAITKNTPHRSSGTLASHVLDIMQTMLAAADSGTTLPLRSRVDRPDPLTPAEAAALWVGAAV